MIPVGILTASATSSFSFLLDQFPGAAAAYSLRKLRAAYTGNCCQVRRSSDNATQDIGFVNNVIDSTALVTFCGSGNGFVSIWYDQSGTGNNAIQATLANQPKIVNLGSIINVNGKPSLEVDLTDFFNVTSIFCPLRTVFSVYKRTASLTDFFPYGGGLGEYIFSNIYYVETSTTLLTSNSADTTSNQVLISTYNTGAASFQYKNNAIIPSTSGGLTRTSTITYLLTLNTINRFSNGNFQEIIIYTINNSSNLSAIDTNINTFYSIY
jgi:hypothetical protein